MVVKVEDDSDETEDCTWEEEAIPGTKNSEEYGFPEDEESDRVFEIDSE